MTVKLAILKSGEDIIADIKEMVVGEGDDKKVVGYFLTRACGISLSNEILKTDDADTDSYKLKLFPWCPLTKDDVIPLAADWVVTIVEPIDKLKQMYEKKVLTHGTSKGVSVDESTDSSEST